jgi:transcriptional regulator with XRE-family HTH domain
MREFGDNVRWRRNAVGLTQAKLAAKVRLRGRPVTQGYISRVESGEYDPPLSVAYSIARALGVKPWTLTANLSESIAFWDGYLSLSGEQKREVQRHIDYVQRKGHT